MRKAATESGDSIAASKKLFFEKSIEQIIIG